MTKKFFLMILVLVVASCLGNPENEDKNLKPPVQSLTGQKQGNLIDANQREVGDDGGHIVEFVYGVVVDHVVRITKRKYKGKISAEAPYSHITAESMDEAEVILIEAINKLKDLRKTLPPSKKPISLPESTENKQKASKKSSKRAKLDPKFKVKAQKGIKEKMKLDHASGAVSIAIPKPRNGAEQNQIKHAAEAVPTAIPKPKSGAEQNQIKLTPKTEAEP